MERKVSEGSIRFMAHWAPASAVTFVRLRRHGSAAPQSLSVAPSRIAVEVPA